MAARLVNESERIYKEIIVVSSEYYPNISRGIEEIYKELRSGEIPIDRLPNDRPERYCCTITFMN
jgi:hypothetical protein